MNDFRKAWALEKFKIRGQHVYLIWGIMTLMMAAWLGYNAWRANPTGPGMIYETPQAYYYADQTAMCMLFGLFIPVMASVLISRLTDGEHQGNTWKLLRTSGETISALWDAKFVLVYLLLEAAVLITMVTTFGIDLLKTSSQFPFGDIALSFVFISLVNGIVLTIAEILSFVYKNQLVVLTVGLAGGMAGVLAGLMPVRAVFFNPWGYYMLCALGGMGGGNLVDGHRVWTYFKIAPHYGFVGVMAIVFIAAGLCTRARLEHRDS